MGNQELMDYFKLYNPMRARHAYGPKGHRGLSFLLFEASPAGYHDAYRWVHILLARDVLEPIGMIQEN